MMWRIECGLPGRYSGGCFISLSWEDDALGWDGGSERGGYMWEVSWTECACLVENRGKSRAISKLLTLIAGIFLPEDLSFSYSL